MKKMTKRLISAILVSVLLFSGMLSTTASALTEKCVEHHFTRLHFNFANDDYQIEHDMEMVPPNTEGTCTYVAMSMFLSFYDTYWNDRFVIDDLEWDNGKYDLSRDELYYTFNANSEFEDLENSMRLNQSYSFYDFANQYQLNYLQPHNPLVYT